MRLILAAVAAAALAAADGPKVEPPRGPAPPRVDPGARAAVDKGPPATPPAMPPSARVLVKTAAGEVLGPLLDVSGNVLVTYVVAIGRPMAIGLSGSDPGTLFFESADCSGVPMLEVEFDYYKAVSIGPEIWARSAGAVIQMRCAASMRANAASCSLAVNRCAHYAAAEPLVDPRHPYAMPLQIVYE
jgi:hypothetical protein